MDAPRSTNIGNIVAGFLKKGFGLGSKAEEKATYFNTPLPVSKWEPNKNYNPQEESLKIDEIFEEHFGSRFMGQESLEDNMTQLEQTRINRILQSLEPEDEEFDEEMIKNILEENMNNDDDLSDQLEVSIFLS